MGFSVLIALGSMDSYDVPPYSFAVRVSANDVARRVPNLQILARKRCTTQLPGQVGTSFSGHQVAVRLRQGQVLGAGQEHVQSCDAVRVEQPLDGTQTFFEHWGAGMSAPQIGQRAANGTQIVPKSPQMSPVLS